LVGPNQLKQEGEKTAAFYCFPDTVLGGMEIMMKTRLDRGRQDDYFDDMVRVLNGCREIFFPPFYFFIKNDEKE
jgi:hypothetical protein